MVFILEVARAQRPGRTSVRFRPEDYMSTIRQLHRSISAKLVDMWDLPAYLKQVIEASSGYDTSKRVSPGNLVCLANAMTKKMKLYLGEADQYEVDATIMIGRSVLGIDEDVVDRLCEGLAERVQDV